MKKIHAYIPFTALLLFASCLNAGTMGETTPEAYSPLVTLTLGPAWSEGGQAGSLQTLSLQPGVQKTYTFDGGWQTVGYGELFLAVEHAITSNWAGQIGLSGAIASHSTVEGSVWEDANPVFNNFVYQYRVKHARLAIKGIVVGHLNYFAEPYVGASFGAGFNRAQSFKVTPVLFEEVAAPIFTNHNKSTYSYALELGLQKEIATHWRGGIGYLFQDWGKSYLERANGQTLGTGPLLNHLYSQAITFSASYVA